MGPPAGAKDAPQQIAPCCDGQSEPQLKYEKLEGDVPSLLQDDSVSCLRLSEKILGLGTESGVVYVLDYSGNMVRCSGKGPAEQISLNPSCFLSGLGVPTQQKCMQTLIYKLSTMVRTWTRRGTAPPCKPCINLAMPTQAGFSPCRSRPQTT